MVFVICLVLIVLDVYVYQAVSFFSNERPLKIYLRGIYWLFTLITLSVILIFAFGSPEKYGPTVRSLMIVYIFANYASKLVAVLFVLIDDIIRIGKRTKNLFKRKEQKTISGESISRSDFLMRTALIGASVPLVTMGYGVVSGAHDYRVRYQKIVLPNLPSSFNGLRIGQISDIHSGSFFNKTAVKGGVEMLINEKPDIIFFTGDLVNNEAGEVKDYISMFGKITAPLGMYSVLGNHDYGDYMEWQSSTAKQKNLEAIIEAHKIMGWDILMNEHRIIKQGGDKLAIIGNENWGAGRFAKYGNIEIAHQGTDEAAVKLLLSHDPSHWDAQIRPNFPDIDVMFAGHTHGFQFGVEVGGFQWSPSQYAYKQWAGLYTEENQHLYVNRGFGYLGYPGRIGMPPELTIVELVNG